MKRQLRQMLSNSANASFNDLRIQAMRWEEEEDSEEEEEKQIRQVSASPATDTTASANKALTDQMSKLTTLVQDQQHQLEQVRSRGTLAPSLIRQQHSHRPRGLSRYNAPPRLRAGNIACYQRPLHTCLFSQKQHTCPVGPLGRLSGLLRHCFTWFC